jgi:hypothetical protein
MPPPAGNCGVDKSNWVCADRPMSKQPAVAGRLGVLEYEVALAAQHPLLIAHEGQGLASAAPAGEPGALSGRDERIALEPIVVQPILRYVLGKQSMIITSSPDTIPKPASSVRGPRYLISKRSSNSAISAADSVRKDQG